MRAPFPWFGGKRKVAAEVWRRFGEVKNYVEPFFGSGAVLLARQKPMGIETINDKDGYVANFWRAVRHDPELTAHFAANPVNENDLHARHAWLVVQRELLRAKLEGDPDFYCAKIAGYWVWGICCWIGAGFCSGRGPWHVVNRQLVHLGDNGQGVNRKLVHLGDNGREYALIEEFSALAERLADVRVCSGDWSRVCGPSVTFKHGTTGVFLDPPYSDMADRTDNLYVEDSNSVSHDVKDWAIEAGKHPDMRVALCGYEGEHNMPSDWYVYAWNAGEGYGSQATDRSGNGKRERIWFSPACLGAAGQLSLLGRTA